MPLLKTISARVRSCRAIISAVAHHGERVAQILDQRFNPILPEAMKIDFLNVMLAVAELVKSACHRLEETEHQLVDERANDRRQQKDRDSIAREVLEGIRDFRDAFQGVYKPINIEEYGFPTLMARTPHDLARQGDHMVEHLTQEGIQLPDPAFGPGLPIAETVTEIRGKVFRLRASINTVESERRLAEAATIEKNRIQDNYDQMFTWGARMLVGLFIWAGEKELADRIVPSTNRPGRTVVIAQDETEPPGDTPPGDTPPGDTPPGDTPPGDTPPLD